MRIGLVALDGCLGAAIAALVDIIGTAEAVRGAVDPAIPPIELSIAGNRRRVTTSSGMVITATRTLRELDDLDVVVSAGIVAFTGPATEAAMDHSDTRALVRALSSLDTQRTRLAAACTSVFPLAEAGHLDGRLATTTWFLTPTFRARYPRVGLDLNRMVVADGPVLTAGAAFAHIDLALAILRSISPELTGHVARLLLIDERPSQSAYVSYDHLQHDDQLVLAFERHVREHLAEPFDVGLVTHAIGTSRRTLERRTREVLGMSPLDIVHRLRLELAAHLRRSSDLSTEAIAARVGYANAETLRALERRAARPG
ncbi:MAG: GlxA family transcriptional regulator [Sporichthyaceae bacterium]